MRHEHRIAAAARLSELIDAAECESNDALVSRLFMQKATEITPRKN